MPPAASQAAVYAAVGAPLVESRAAGVLFSFGVSNSGKSHTLLRGCAPPGPREDAGVLPRLVTGLFEAGATTLTVSVLEIYNEQAFDLLLPARAGPLKLAAAAGALRAPELTEASASSRGEALALLARGLGAATTESTELNARSSRGHTVITLTPAPEAGVELPPAITLVDMAGLERTKTSGVVGRRMRESSAINASIMRVTNVLKALKFNADRPRRAYEQAYNTVQPGPPQSSGRMQGIGSDPSYDPSRPAAPDLSQRMEGWMGTARAGAAAIMKDPLATQFSAGRAGPPGQEQVLQRTGGEYGMRSNVGGAWGGGGGNPNLGGPGRAGVPGHPARQAPAPARGGLSGGGAAAAAGEYEKALILALTPAAGLGLAPPASELRDFLGVFQGLDADAVAIELLERLQEPSAAVKGRTFNVMKAMVDAEAGDPNSAGRYTDFFATCADEILSVARQEPKAAVRALGTGLHARLAGGKPEAKAPPPKAAPPPPPP
ncbi:hypothetical protein TeGR_g10720, partial [Tetraparma gracilis]